MQQIDANDPAQHNTGDNERPPYILALDIGTSSTRALLFDASGASVPHVTAHRAYTPTTGDDGEVTTDPDHLVDLTIEVIDEALRAAGPLADHITAVATDTYWHSLIAIDASGRPLTPALTWADTRARTAVRELRQRFDDTAIHARTGATIHTSYWPAKLRWLAQTQPDIFNRAAQFISLGEYLHRRLLGRSVCSLSMASGTGLLVTQARQWDTALLDALGVPHERLPALGDLSLADALQGLTPTYAARWPKLHTVPWFPALGDGAAANVGSGCATPGRIALTVGTSSAVRAITPLAAGPAPQGLWRYLLDGRRATLGGALSEGGNLFNWIENTFRVDPLPQAQSEIASLQPDAHGLTILPFVAGERSLGWRGDARLTISGALTHTAPLAILRASVEALAYRIAAVYARLAWALDSAPPASATSPTVGSSPPRMLIGSGGALLGSPIFQQVIADTIGAPLYPSREREASARGAALMALEALGALRDAATSPAQLEQPIQPDPAHGAIYRRAAERQQRLYQAIFDGSAV